MIKYQETKTESIHRNHNPLALAELIEEMTMKEKPHPPMDPVLEECYQMKAEFAARFKTCRNLLII